MNYFKDDNNQIFAYDDEQVKNGCGEGLSCIKYEEVEFIVSERVDSIKSTVKYKINEAKQYLLDTDYKMTVDYYEELPLETQRELKRLRSEARELIRASNELQHPTL